MTIMTREQIEALPVQSVADVLRLASSVDVRACAACAGSRRDFAVRGANFGQMLVLVDGVRLNDAQSGHHNGDIPVPLDAVERIEILLGSGVGDLRRRRVRRDGQRDHPARREPPSLDGPGGQLRSRRRPRSGGVRARSASASRWPCPPIDRRASCTTATSGPPSSGRSTAIGSASTVSLLYLWKGFGANNFYGGQRAVA